MPTNVIEIAGQRCLVFDATGPEFGDANSAREIVEEALGERASLIAVPVGRLGDAFFQLRTGVAGEMLQKAANYRLRFAVIGDVSAHVAASDAFRDLVVESERSESLYFAKDVQALTERLRSRSG